MKAQSFEGKLLQLRNRNAAWKICAALSLITGLVTPFSAYAQENAEVAPRAIPVNAGPNDVARFLAGMPVPENSPGRANDARLRRGGNTRRFLKSNSQNSISDSSRNCTPGNRRFFQNHFNQFPWCFTCSAGPIFCTSISFFQELRCTCFAVKKLCGPPPDPLRIANLSGALGNLENAMKSSLNTTYFITKDMKVDLHEQNLNGVLPILYTFIARAGKSITNVTFGSLSSSGVFEEAASGKKGGSISGVRIRYTDNQTGNSQTVFYFTTDISDGGIKATPGFLKFCQRLGAGASILKSPSYLLFENGFATIRNFILDHSNLIVQDDSGIPLAYFDPNKWSLRFFGVYLGPIEVFKQHYQPQLRELFEEANSPPLDFGFGYRWNYKEANLIVATRK